MPLPLIAGAVAAAPAVIKGVDSLIKAIPGPKEKEQRRRMEREQRIAEDQLDRIRNEGQLFTDDQRQRMRGQAMQNINAQLQQQQAQLQRGAATSGGAGASGMTGSRLADAFRASQDASRAIDSDIRQNEIKQMAQQEYALANRAAKIEQALIAQRQERTSQALQAAEYAIEAAGAGATGFDDASVANRMNDAAQSGDALTRAQRRAQLGGAGMDDPAITPTN